MSRLAARFESLAAQGRKALIPYVTAGDPSREQTIEVMHALVRAGADVIELGVPFSDPMADGPVIQRSSERALERGVSLKDCLDWVEGFRKSDANTPVVLMGYANPVERMGTKAFVERAKSVGVDGVLIVDYPPEECEAFGLACREAGVDLIFLLAPTSSNERMDQVARIGSGYLYYVSLRGVTGAANLDATDVAEKVKRIRSHTQMPIGVGFGISDATSAKAIGQHADAVVIGSALIRLMESSVKEKSDPIKSLESFLRSIRVALDELAPAK